MLAQARRRCNSLPGGSTCARGAFLMRCFVVTATLSMGAHMTAAEIKTEQIVYRHGEVVLEGVLAYDASVAEKRPGVLVVHEWWGCNDFARRQARRLAELGYVAFALDMYGKGVTTTSPEEASKLAGALYGDVQLLRGRAKAGLDVLASHARVDASRLGAVGYCFGGMTCMQMAYAGSDLRGVVSFHGSLPTPEASDPTPFRAAILACHGADDPLVPDERVAAFVSAMKASRSDWQMISYGGAVHSFTNPDADKVGIAGVAYNRAADERSWRHMQDFFNEKLGGPRTNAR